LGPAASSPPAVVTASAAAPTFRSALGAPVDLPASTAGDALPPETTAGLIQAIRLQWKQGIGEAQIRLEPQHFGEMSVAIRVDQGQVVARLQADSPAVRDWLQANQHWLRHGLAEQQLTLDRLEISDMPSAGREPERRDGDGRRGQEQTPPRRPRTPDGAPRFEVVA
jgi:flagellar hook-length control protein FliK